MGALVVALLIITVMVIASLSAFVALRSRRTRPVPQAPNPVHPHAPSYRRQAENTEYYRPGETRKVSAPSPARQGAHDLKKGPLPHCPLCDAAVGFDDARCPKCRHVLKGR